MRDSYNREISYLRVSVTDRCNLRCLYCMPKEGVSLLGHDDILSYEEILRVIREAVALGITKVRVTGGEPLVRRGLLDFLHALKQLPLQDLSLTTNGILLEVYAEKLFDAGIRRINVSLDSLHPEKYARITRGGNLHSVLRGIERAERIGFAPIKINTVALRGINDDEILDIARLTLEKPYQVRFIELMPTGRIDADVSERYLSADVIMARIGAFRKLHAADRHGRGIDGPARIYRMEGAMGEIGFISPVSSHFCDLCNRLRLTADGHLRSCLLSDDELDLKTPLRSGCTDQELRDMIRQSILKKPQRHALDGGVLPKRRPRKEMPQIGG
ncbi:MAG TPA: GTP 3',8-cyclase MoaA [Syntrophales bacterium]|nr:GTP 3',8-cyclase MoaA [Syntrophales bacterium]